MLLLVNTLNWPRNNFLLVRIVVHIREIITTIFPIVDHIILELASCKSLDWTTGPQRLEPQLAPTHAGPQKAPGLQEASGKTAVLVKWG